MAASSSPAMADEVKEAAGPYPHRLQHREVTYDIVRHAAQAVAAHHAHVASANGEKGGSRRTATTGSQAMSSVAENEIENQEGMRAATAKRQAAAQAVMEASGRALAQPVGQLSPIDIFHAACNGDVEALRHNVDAGADLNALGQPNCHAYDGTQFQQRWSFVAPPLVFAAAWGRERAVDALLQWGADACRRSSTGLTAREYAQHRGYVSIVRMLEVAEAAASST